MAAEPPVSNQPLVNGQNETDSSKGNTDRDTVDGDRDQQLSKDLQRASIQIPVGAAGPHLNWPRQQRPPDFRGFAPGPRPHPQGARRISPWAVLRTKLPEQQGFRAPGLEHSIHRMQNPEDLMRPRIAPDLNGYARSAMAMNRPPSGQLSKPPSFEGHSPTPPGPTPPRSPFLQRVDSRAGGQMFSPPPPSIGGKLTQGQPLGNTTRPPSLSPRPPNITRSFEDDEQAQIGTPPIGNRPPSTVRFPNPSLVRTGSTGSTGTLPSQPPSRTTTPSPAPQSPIPPGLLSMKTTPQPSRQSSLSSSSEQNAPTTKVDHLDGGSVKSSTPSPRPLSAATSQESDAPPEDLVTKTEIKMDIKSETKDKPSEEASPQIPCQPPTVDTTSTIEPAIKREDGPKRPDHLDTAKRDETATGSSSIKADTKETPTTATEESKEAVLNGNHETPKRLPPKGSAPKKLGSVPSTAKSPSKSLPKTPDTPGTSEKKKVPMNKIQVGAAPSPNLKVVKSKIGSLDNSKHKPGGGHVKIESRKLEFRATPRIEAKNDAYAPGGGEKKIQQVKLQWNAKSKIGSLENATHKPGGGDKKIESMKLDFKDKAKSKVGSKDNIKHTPGGGQVKIEDQKLEIKAQSKIGSMENVKHRPGGGEVKIFDDKDYMKQMMGSTSDVHSASNQGRRTSRSSSSSRTRLSGSKSGTRENLTDDLSSPEKPISKPLVKPTDQNSNQLNRGSAEIGDKSGQPESNHEAETIGTDGKKTVGHDDRNEPPRAHTTPLNPPAEPPKTSTAPLINNIATQPNDDLHSVIEKSQTETSEKELSKP